MQGSCTACILVLEGNQLHEASLGDSGFLVVRNGKVVYKSEPEQVSFDYPYQLHMPGAARGQLPCHADVSFGNHALQAYHMLCAILTLHLSVCLSDCRHVTWLVMCQHVCAIGAVESKLYM